jgi:aryl-alcohol dehydrogenase-like predicted oxidoreductase
MTAPLVLGASVFGWTVDRATAFRLLDRYAEAGGTMIDTADCYGDSEAWIGEWLRASGMRGRIAVATKVGFDAGLGPERIRVSAEASLARLGVDAIDLYYAHRDDPAVPQEQVLAAFAALIGAGKVRAIGASSFSAERLESALAVADRTGLPRFTALQLRYNLLTRDDYEGSVQRLALARGLAVHPYFALARGFLTGKYRTPADLARSPRGGQMAPLLSGRPQALLATMDQVAAETGAGLAAIALAWLATRPGVTAPVVSATSIAQLDELLAARDLALSPAQLARLERA